MKEVVVAKYCFERVARISRALIIDSPTFRRAEPRWRIILRSLFDTKWEHVRGLRGFTSGQIYGLGILPCQIYFRKCLDVVNYMTRAGDQIQWGTTFRRAMREVEENQFMCLLQMLERFHVVDNDEDSRIWLPSSDGTFLFLFFSMSLLESKSRIDPEESLQFKNSIINAETIGLYALNALMT